MKSAAFAAWAWRARDDDAQTLAARRPNRRRPLCMNRCSSAQHNPILLTSNHPLDRSGRHQQRRSSMRDDAERHREEDEEQRPWLKLRRLRAEQVREGRGCRGGARRLRPPLTRRCPAGGRPKRKTSPNRKRRRRSSRRVARARSLTQPPTPPPFPNKTTARGRRGGRSGGSSSG